MAITINGSTGVQLDDNDKQEFGTSDDLKIYHDGNNSVITAGGAGDLQLTSTFDDVIIQAADNIFINPQGGEDGLKVYGDGAVELYYDNAKVFETLEYGARIKRPSGGASELDIVGCEGQGAELRLIADDGDDNADYWRLQSNTNGYFYLANYGDGAWETNILAKPAAETQLYYDNSKKFQTTNIGIQSMGTVETGGTIFPTTDDYHNVGGLSNRWNDIIATNGSIVTSDKNEKNTIVDSDLGLSFVNKLKPVSYKFNGKTRTHYGLIAQDVETTLSDISKPTTDFAGFIKDDTDDGTKYGLRYNEFISPLIKAVQELSVEVDTLKAKVAALEGA